MPSYTFYSNQKITNPQYESLNQLFVSYFVYYVLNGENCWNRWWKLDISIVYQRLVKMWTVEDWLAFIKITNINYWTWSKTKLVNIAWHSVSFQNRCTILTHSASFPDYSHRIHKYFPSLNLKFISNICTASKPR